MSDQEQLNQLYNVIEARDNTIQTLQAEVDELKALVGEMIPIIDEHINALVLAVRCKGQITVERNSAFYENIGKRELILQKAKAIGE